MRVASAIHKWLALLMAIQIVFWFASGLFFALAPIDQVRSEHMVADPEQPSLSLSRAAQALYIIEKQLKQSPVSVELGSLMGQPVAVVEDINAQKSLFDLNNGEKLSPISADMATQIAERHLAGLESARSIERVSTTSTEYRGALPAWKVNFKQADRAVYVAVDTGKVTARRSTLWRWFDFFWALHIMDWGEREDFNTPLLIGSAMLTLVITISGIVIMPGRLGLGRWRRRRRNRNPATTTGA